MTTDTILIKRESLADAVVNKLQHQIASNHYKIGERLPSEPELMHQFGVGRSTIREAIRILVNKGLIRVQQGVGTFVELQQNSVEPFHQSLSRAEGDDVNEVRQLLELKIAEKAALNRTQEDIDVMTGYLQKRHEAALQNRPEECIEADIQFHIRLAMASKNEVLVDLYRIIANKMKKSFMEVFITTETLLSKQTMHTSLLQSVADRDPKKAWYWAAKITGQIR
ncbi:FadR/GntR family transcriptional regulator [Larkinella humicola]|uniref:FadR family transcriptional regulator n=1 Tax=Larkinella humicola TaxID=2607654 RepID=A0A5N1JKI0_9BACT|nr:FadR/GntR family transcriptional regulator [Larkinella humicola]KAA9356674.1 FadR family transcriptional regulator [Larkinella humicola]